MTSPAFRVTTCLVSFKFASIGMAIYYFKDTSLALPCSKHADMISWKEYRLSPRI